MKIAEGVSVLSGWYTNGVKWLKGRWTPESWILKKKRSRGLKKEIIGKKNSKRVFYFPVQSIKFFFPDMAI